MYIVIEIQKNGDTTSTIVTTYNSIEEAKSKYFTILAAAALSEVQTHGASIILAETGKAIQYEVFDRTDYGV